MKDFFGKNADGLKNKKLFLFDMDGTIYLGNSLFEGIPELLQKITNVGAKYVFITNNSSRSVSDYIKKLYNLGLTGVTEENFFTSTQASVNLLKKNHANKLIYAQGTNSFIQELKNSGLNVTTEYSDNVQVVLVGYDPELTGEKIYNTCKILTLLNVEYYATNPDWVCPIEFGYLPDCGSMCKCYEKATGKTPVFIGKPQPEMIYSVMEKFGVSKSETVVIGDRLYTDVASGNNAGVETVCVLSGEVTLQEVINAQEKEKPTYTFDWAKNII